MLLLGEELLIASRRIAFALTDTLANEVPPFTSHMQVPSLLPLKDVKRTVEHKLCKKLQKGSEEIQSWRF